MKQWIALLMTVMVVALAMPVVLADNGSTISDNTTVNATVGIDPQTLHEIEAMDSAHGATMRMLELEKAIEQRILYAQAVMPVVNNKTNVSANDTTQLNADIATLQVLYDNASTVPTNTSDAVKQYVDIKQQADRTIADFRRIARQYLTPDDIASLTVQFEAIDKTQLDALDAQIKAEMDSFNSERVQMALTAMGVTNAQLVADVESGKISGADARAMLRDTFSGLTKQQKLDAAAALQEWNVRLKVQREMHMTEVSEGMSMRLAALTQRLSDRLGKAGFPNAAARLENESQRLGNLSMNIEAWQENHSNETPRPGLGLGVRGGMGGGNGPFQPGYRMMGNNTTNDSDNTSVDVNVGIGGTQ